MLATIGRRFLTGVKSYGLNQGLNLAPEADIKPQDHDIWLVDAHV